MKGLTKMKNEETKTHPSYGTLRFNRAYGGKTTLFGSSIEHENTITMELYHANITRELNRDFIFGSKPIVKLEMSYSQFAEAISSFGQGTGVPVTIRYTEKDGNLPMCDFVSKTEQFTNEFKDHIDQTMNESQQLIANISKLFAEKKSLTKADKEDILRKLNKLHADIGGNMGFIADQFNEQMDKTMTEAKGEIEAFCQNKINTMYGMAMAEHRDDILPLENPVDVK